MGGFGGHRIFGKKEMELAEEDGWLDGWMDGWRFGWVDGWMEAWVDGWMDGGMGGWMEVWVGGWMRGWVDGGVGGWMEIEGRVEEGMAHPISSASERFSLSEEIKNCLQSSRCTCILISIHTSTRTRTCTLTPYPTIHCSILTDDSLSSPHEVRVVQVTYRVQTPKLVSKTSP